MSFGLYGKLPQKRDFVTMGVPRPVLEPFEAWLQSAVAASRSELGRDWEAVFLVAPLWRFWIGSAILGANCAGAIMPSVDRVGRYFPLVILYTAQSGAELPPPPLSPQGSWFAALEERLLSALDGKDDMVPGTLLVGLPDPATEVPAPAPGTMLVRGRPLRVGEAGADVAPLFAGMGEADYRDAARLRSFWWTAGGTAGRPAVYARDGLPDPYFYTRMLRLVAD